jgi:hypothetical protein
MANCANCGTPLNHPNEACPNCLSGSGLTERPPTRPYGAGMPKTRREMRLEAEITRLEAELEKVKADYENVRARFEALIIATAPKCATRGKSETEKPSET